MSSVRGYCKTHYGRLRKSGDLKIVKKVGGYGKGHVTPGGYRRIFRPGHPNASKKGLLFEHRWVMSQHLGRPLLASEDVHHINGDKLDNRLENLELWSIGQPRGQRVTDKIEWAIGVLAIYAPEKLASDVAASERVGRHQTAVRVPPN